MASISRASSNEACRNVVATLSEQRRESSERISAFQRMNSVSKNAEDVHPSGQPISHSTKRGAKRGFALDDRPPGVRVLWTGRMDTEVESAAAWPLSNNSSERSPLRDFRPPSVSATVGALHMLSA